MVTAINSKSSTTSEWLTFNQSSSPETLMLQVQLLVAKDFDVQMRDVAEKIKMLSDVKRAYRENINTIKQFMAQNQDTTTRKDKKAYYDASPQQMEKLFGSFKKYNYDIDNIQFDPTTDYTSMSMLQDAGYKTTASISDFASEVAALEASGNHDAAKELAKEAQTGVERNFPFFYGKLYIGYSVFYIAYACISWLFFI